MRLRNDQILQGFARHLPALACAACALALSSAPAQAGGTTAGTLVENRATATYSAPDGTDANILSNVVSLRVDEVLDLAVAPADPGDVAVTPGTSGVLRFTLTNTGNGTERYTLVTQANSAGDDYDPTVTSIVLDANANGAYDAGVDTVYVAGSNDPELAPDSAISVFVLATVPAAATDGQRGRIDLIATTNTGTGTPGANFAGQGQGGGDAIVGLSGGSGEDQGFLSVTRADLSFVKSAIVADPFGGSSPMPGATITYSLNVAVTGTGSLANVRITDPIPAGTTYRPGSITLDGSALSDAADGDAGRFATTEIAVALGSVASGVTHVISFQVRID